MKISNMQSPRHPGSGDWRALAEFDVQLTAEIRLCGMRLLEGPGGIRRSYAPSSGGRRFATFAPELAKAITQAAVNKYEARGTADDQQAA